MAWDTQFSPVDVRTLAAAPSRASRGPLVFDRQADGRTKTGRAAIGTVSARTEQLVTAYLDKLGIDLHPDAVLFRNRSGNPYRADTLSDDFADVRELAFPGDKRRLMDMRRSGVVEAIAGDAGPLGLSAKLANSIERSNSCTRPMRQSTLKRCCSADAARLKGRRRCAPRTKAGAKVSKEQPSEFQMANVQMANVFDLYGDPGRIRTCDLQLRRLILALTASRHRPAGKRQGLDSPYIALYLQPNDGRVVPGNRLSNLPGVFPKIGARPSAPPAEGHRK